MRIMSVTGWAAAMAFVIAPAQAPAQPPQGSVEGDRAALLALYYATDGPNWYDNWEFEIRFDEPLDDWPMVGTREDGRVDWLSLSTNDLRVGAKIDSDFCYMGSMV